MTNNKNNTDVTKSISRRLLRTGAIFAAAGAMVVLLTSGTVAGQTADDMGATTRPAATQPSGQPMGQPMGQAMTQPTTPPANPSTGMVSEGVSAEGGIHLTPGKSVVVTLKHGVKDPQFNVPNPDVADVTPMSYTTFLVTGKKPGVLAIVIFDKETGKSQVVDVIVEPDLAMLTKQIKHTFPTLDLTVTALNDTIAVRGQVPSAMVAEQIVEMATAFGKVHNFLDIAGGQQVMLQVRFAEVSKSALRSLGVTFGGTDGISSVATNGLSNAAMSFTGTSPGLGIASATAGSGVTLFGQGRFGVVAFDYFVSALRTNGLVRTLAEPNVIAESGTTATLLAGGQVPIPVPQPGNGGSTITIEYHDYGVRLNFTPQVLGNGKIKLKVAPEVSDLDYSVGVSVAGTTVPGFTDRKVDTTVELGDGQSFALAGLLNNKISASNTAIPLLGDIPILGALFTSTSYQRNETELVVLVTPRLVSAMNPDAVPTLPGEKWRYPNQLQSYLFHDLGGPANSAKSRADMKTEGQPPQFHGSYGFTAVGSGTVTAVDPMPAK